MVAAQSLPNEQNASLRPIAKALTLRLDSTSKTGRVDLRANLSLEFIAVLMFLDIFIINVPSM